MKCSPNPSYTALVSGKKGKQRNIEKNISVNYGQMLNNTDGETLIVLFRDLKSIQASMKDNLKVYSLQLKVVQIVD